MILYYPTPIFSVLRIVLKFFIILPINQPQEFAFRWRSINFGLLIPLFTANVEVYTLRFLGLPGGCRYSNE